jgi:hypothetical protein
LIYLEWINNLEIFVVNMIYKCLREDIDVP